MSVELWLIRHGETAWSLSGAHTSRTDLPLTDQGRARAVVDEGLREWDYGDAEGKTTPQIRAEYNDPAWGVWNRELINGEALHHVGERADVVIGRALDGTPDNGKVALFAHAHILRILAARWLGLEASAGKSFLLGTGSVSVLGWERETPVVVHWNRGFDD